MIASQIDLGDGLSVAVRRRHGKGTPLLFLCGWAVPASTWLGVIEDLPERDCVLLDSRGQGDSSPLPASQSIIPLADHVRDAVEVMERVIDGPCHVIGHSLGGRVGLELALAHPTRVASLALIGSSADGELPENRAAYLGLADAIEQQGITEHILGIAYAVWLSARGSADASPGGMRSRAATLLQAADRHAIAAGLRGIVDRPSRLGELSRLRLPVLSLIGSEDRSISAERQRDTARRLPDCTIVEIPGGGHLPFLEHPAEMAHALHEHFQRAEALV
jgi:pimeloyl-ACP methyl ester carboxylesterase